MPGPGIPPDIPRPPVVRNAPQDVQDLMRFVLENHDGFTLYERIKDRLLESTGISTTPLLSGGYYDWTDFLYQTFDLSGAAGASTLTEYTRAVIEARVRAGFIVENAATCINGVIDHWARMLDHKIRRVAKSVGVKVGITGAQVGRLDQPSDLSQTRQWSLAQLRQFEPDHQAIAQEANFLGSNIEGFVEDHRRLAFQDAQAMWQAAAVAASKGSPADILGRFRGRRDRNFTLEAVYSSQGSHAEDWRTRIRGYAQFAAEDADRIVRTALREGMGVRELSRRLRPYVTAAEPFHRAFPAAEVPKKLYDLRKLRGPERLVARQVQHLSERIAYTEVWNAKAEAEVEHYVDDPVVRAVRWTLSPNRGALDGPDECDVLARNDFYGMGKGVYPLDRVPFPPHPWDRCSRVPVLATDDELRRGAPKAAGIAPRVPGKLDLGPGSGGVTKAASKRSIDNALSNVRDASAPIRKTMVQRIRDQQARRAAVPAAAKPPATAAEKVLGTRDATPEDRRPKTKIELAATAQAFAEARDARLQPLKDETASLQREFDDLTRQRGRAVRALQLGEPAAATELLGRPPVMVPKFVKDAQGNLVAQDTKVMSIADRRKLADIKRGIEARQKGIARRFKQLDRQGYAIQQEADEQFYQTLVAPEPGKMKHPSRQEFLGEDVSPEVADVQDVVEDRTSNTIIAEALLKDVTGEGDRKLSAGVPAGALNLTIPDLKNPAKDAVPLFSEVGMQRYRDYMVNEAGPTLNAVLGKQLINRIGAEKVSKMFPGMPKGGRAAGLMGRRFTQVLGESAHVRGPEFGRALRKGTATEVMTTGLRTTASHRARLLDDARKRATTIQQKARQLATDVSKGVKRFNQLVGPAFTPPDVPFPTFEAGYGTSALRHTRVRADYLHDQDGGVVHVGGGVRGLTAWDQVPHELGHWIEHHFPAVLRREVEWRDKRIAASGQFDSPMQAVNANDNETGYRDKFHQRYVGRFYGTQQQDGRFVNTATEVLSSGLQMMAGEPLSFYHRDPDYFWFVYDTLRQGPGDERGDTPVVGQHKVRFK